MVKSEEWDKEKLASKKSEKNTTSVAHSKDGKKISFGFASDAFKQGLSGNLYNDDWKVDSTVAFEEKPAKKEWKAKNTYAVSSPVLAEKMRLWFNVS
jgi:hypothetical protein